MFPGNFNGHSLDGYRSIAVRLSLVGTVLYAISGWLWGHELPEGTVERAIQATVTLGQVEVIYDFGFHPKTVERLWLTAGHRQIEDEVQLAAEFLAWQSQYVARHVVVQWGERRCQPVHVDWMITYQHHLQFRCRMRYVLPAVTTRQRLVIRDEGFGEWPGYFRVALRAKPPSLLHSSDAALLVVRAERQAAQRLGPGQGIAPRMEAVINPMVAERDANGVVALDSDLVQSEHGPPHDSTRTSSNAERASGQRPTDAPFTSSSNVPGVTDDAPMDRWWFWLLVVGGGACCLWLTWYFIHK